MNWVSIFCTIYCRNRVVYCSELLLYSILGQILCKLGHSASFLQSLVPPLITCPNQSLVVQIVRKVCVFTGLELNFSMLEAALMAGLIKRNPLREWIHSVLWRSMNASMHLTCVSQQKGCVLLLQSVMCRSLGIERPSEVSVCARPRLILCFVYLLAV